MKTTPLFLWPMRVECSSCKFLRNVLFIVFMAFYYMFRAHEPSKCDSVEVKNNSCPAGVL